MNKPVTKKQMEDRFEKQKRMLQKSQDRQTEEIKDYVDKTFDSKFDSKFEEKFEELKDFAETLVENVKAEVGGAYRDELETVKDRVTRIERKAGIAGPSSRIV